MVDRNEKRARPSEARYQLRSIQLHQENRARITREREAMAAQWKPKSRAAVATRFKIRCATGEASISTAERKRDCMRCETPFMSTGPHHRLCRTCRRLTEGLADHG